MAELPKIGGQAAGDVVHSNGYVDRMFRVAIANVDATDEWVDTGLSKIVALLAFNCVSVAAPPTVPPVFKKNAQGTSTLESSTNGALAVASSDAGLLWEIVVRGIP